MLSVLARGAVRAAAPSRVVERTIWSSDAVLRALRGLTARAMSGAPAAEEPAAGERERMEYDVLVVGAGPAGLSCAIKLKQLCQASGTELSVCVIEKGHEVGAHIISGNVFEPHALNELIPDWKLNTPAKEDFMYFLTGDKSIPLPTIPMLHNEGNYIISLAQLTRWLGKQAEELGVDIFPGTPASEVVYNESGAVAGIAVSDVGIAKDGSRKGSFARGMELRAKQTVFAEGAKGSCSDAVMDKFKLRANCDTQTYGLGMKEVWRVPKSHHKSGRVQHTIGWPLPSDAYGGSFMYHMDPDHILVGFVVGLNYKNPFLSPYGEFQRFKHHPLIAPQLEGGTCMQYGARVINEGGLQAIPKLTFPGGALIGCSAGFVNVPKVKGTHTAMKSGMLAAEAIHDTLKAKNAASQEAVSYESSLRASWVWKEMTEVRNFGPSFHHYGMYGGVMYSGISGLVLRGREPWTLHTHVADRDATQPAKMHEPVKYPKPDGVLSFDILSNLARSGTNHEHDQPSHLQIRPGMEKVPSDVSHKVYAAPESRFCPAKVYEYPDGGDKLVINAQNCLHCKCCAIKTPKEFVKWTVPEAGGGGPA